MADLLLSAMFAQRPAEAEGPAGDAGEDGDEDQAAAAHCDSSPALDMDASPEEVLRRIQSAALWFISQLCEGRLPDMEVAQRGASNHALAAAPGRSGSDDDEGAGLYRLQMHHHTQLRSLAGRHPESAESVARLFVLLEAVHANLLAGLTATQREMWYKLKTLEVFRSPRNVGEAIQDAVGMLQVPRSALGITASSKGLVAGRLTLHDQRAGMETDCAALGSRGVPIPGDIAHLLRDLAFRSDARLVLVVEKDAVFQRLAQQRFFDVVPCVLVTAKGVPDLATRAFLSRLCAALPDMKLLGLVDWNPAGVNILCIYRFGSHRMGLESPHYALPMLGWLGARSEQLQHADAGAFQELTGRDRSMAANLAAALHEAAPEWAAELRHMVASGSKAELEALDTVGGGADLPELLAACLEAGDCI